MIFNDDIKKEIWIRIGTCSRRALRKRVKKGGRQYKYSPRSDLIINLSYELNLPFDVIANHLVEMHTEILESDTI